MPYGQWRNGSWPAPPLWGTAAWRDAELRAQQKRERQTEDEKSQEASGSRTPQPPKAEEAGAAKLNQATKVVRKRRHDEAIRVSTAPSAHRSTQGGKGSGGSGDPGESRSRTESNMSSAKQAMGLSKRCTHTVHKWGPRKDKDFSQSSVFRYALPPSSGSGYNDDYDDLWDESLELEASSRHMADGELTLYNASKLIAAANVPVEAVKAITERFVWGLDEENNDELLSSGLDLNGTKKEKRVFTDHFIEATSLYGDMFDQISEMYKTTGSLATSLEAKNQRAGHLQKLIGVANGDADGSALEFMKLHVSIKLIREFMTKLNFEKLRNDFSRWCKHSRSEAGTMGNLLEAMSAESDSLLHFLTVSKAEVDSTFASHESLFASTLATFFQKLKTFIEMEGIEGSTAGVHALKLEQTLNSLQKVSASKATAANAAKGLSGILQSNAAAAEADMQARSTMRKTTFGDAAGGGEDSDGEGGMEALEGKAQVLSSRVGKRKMTVAGVRQAFTKDDKAMSKSLAEYSVGGSESPQSPQSPGSPTRRQTQNNQAETFVQRTMIKAKQQLENILAKDMERVELVEQIAYLLRRDDLLGGPLMPTPSQGNALANTKTSAGAASAVAGDNAGDDGDGRDEDAMDDEEDANCRSSMSRGRRASLKHTDIQLLHARKEELYRKMNQLYSGVSLTDVYVSKSQTSSNLSPTATSGSPAAASAPTKFPSAPGSRTGAGPSSAAVEVKQFALPPAASGKGSNVGGTAPSGTSQEQQSEHRRGSAGFQKVMGLLTERLDELKKKVELRNHLLDKKRQEMKNFCQRVNTSCGEKVWFLSSSHKWIPMLNPRRRIVDYLVDVLAQLAANVPPGPVSKQLQAHQAELTALVALLEDEAKDKKVKRSQLMPFDVESWEAKIHPVYAELVPRTAKLILHTQEEQLRRLSESKKQAAIQKQMEASAAARGGWNSATEALEREIVDLNVLQEAKVAILKDLQPKLEQLEDTYARALERRDLMQEIVNLWQNESRLREQLMDEKFRLGCMDRAHSQKRTEVRRSTSQRRIVTQHGDNVGHHISESSNVDDQNHHHQHGYHGHGRENYHRSQSSESSHHGGGRESYHHSRTSHYHPHEGTTSAAHRSIKAAMGKGAGEITASKELKWIQKQNGQLKQRVERKREDLRRLIESVKDMVDGNVSNILESRQVLHNRWLAEMHTWRAGCAVQNRMINFWNQRFTTWHTELAGLYGEKVAEMFRDADRTAQDWAQPIVAELAPLLQAGVVKHQFLHKREGKGAGQGVERNGRRYGRTNAMRSFENLQFHSQSSDSDSDKSTNMSPAPIASHNSHKRMALAGNPFQNEAVIMENGFLVHAHDPTKNKQLLDAVQAMRRRGQVVSGIFGGQMGRKNAMFGTGEASNQYMSPMIGVGVDRRWKTGQARSRFARALMMKDLGGMKNRGMLTQKAMAAIEAGLRKGKSLEECMGYIDQEFGASDPLAGGWSGMSGGSGDRSERGFDLQHNVIKKRRTQVNVYKVQQMRRLLSMQKGASGKFSSSSSGSPSSSDDEDRSRHQRPRRHGRRHQRDIGELIRSGKGSSDSHDESSEDESRSPSNTVARRRLQTMGPAMLQEGATPDMNKGLQANQSGVVDMRKMSSFQGIRGRADVARVSQQALQRRKHSDFSFDESLQVVHKTLENIKHRGLRKSSKDEERRSSKVGVLKLLKLLDETEEAEPGPPKSLRRGKAAAKWKKLDKAKQVPDIIVTGTGEKDSPGGTGAASLDGGASSSNLGASRSSSRGSLRKGSKRLSKNEDPDIGIGAILAASGLVNPSGLQHRRSGAVPEKGRVLSGNKRRLAMDVSEELLALDGRKHKRHHHHHHHHRHHHHHHHKKQAKEQRETSKDRDRPDEEEDNEEAPGQKGLHILRRCRERLLTVFGSADAAFEWAAGGAQALDREALSHLFVELGVPAQDTEEILKHVTLLQSSDVWDAVEAVEGGEVEKEHAQVLQLSSEAFADVIATAVPVRKLRHLKERLVKKFGKIANAFQSALGASSASEGVSATHLSLRAFQGLLLGVGASGHEACKLFQMMQLHNEVDFEYSEETGESADLVTMNAFTSALKYAPHLEAAGRLCHVLGLGQSARAIARRRESLQTGGQSAQAKAFGQTPFDNGSTLREVDAYCRCLQLIGPTYLGRSLSLEEFQQALRPIPLSPHDPKLLFRLVDAAERGAGAETNASESRVKVHEMLLLAIGGLGTGSARLAAYAEPVVEESGLMKRDVALMKRRKSRKQSVVADYRSMSRRSSVGRGLKPVQWGGAGSIQVPIVPLGYASRQALREAQRLRQRAFAPRETHRNWRHFRAHLLALMKKAEAMHVARIKGTWELHHEYIPAVTLALKRRGRGAERANLRPPRKPKALRKSLHALADDASAIAHAADDPDAASTAGRADEASADSETAKEEDSADAASEADSSPSTASPSSRRPSFFDTHFDLGVLSEASAPHARKADRKVTAVLKKLDSSQSLVHSKSKPLKAALSGDLLVSTHIEEEDEASWMPALAEEEKPQIVAEWGDLSSCWALSVLEDDGGLDVVEINRTGGESDREIFEEREARDRTLHRRCREIFGDARGAVEHEIALQRLRDLCEALLGKFKSSRIAFEKLCGGTTPSSAGGTAASQANVPTMTVSFPLEFQKRVEKLLSFNALDARRLALLLETLGVGDRLDYVKFLEILRFARPVTSVLDFRRRLIQRHGSLEVALRLLNLDEAEIDVGQFERALLPDGVDGKDSARLFHVLDVAKGGGAPNELSGAAIRFGLEFAHALAWLMAMVMRVRAGPGGHDLHTTISAAVPDAMEDIRSADDLSILLGRLGAPRYHSDQLFAFLQRRAAAAGSDTISSHDFVGLLASLGEDNSGVPVVSTLSSSAIGTLHGGSDRHNSTASPVVSPRNHRTSGAKHNSVLKARRRESSAFSFGHGSAGDVAHDRFARVGLATDEDREQAMQALRVLLNHVKQHFSNYSRAFALFKAKQPEMGVSHDEWMLGMDVIGFPGEPGAWELIFGKIVDWRHAVWDPKYRGSGGRVTQQAFQEALELATPCRRATLLRQRLQKAGSLQKAWQQIAGKANSEEISREQWQHGLQSFSVCVADADFLMAQLRAMPLDLTRLDTSGHLHMTASYKEALAKNAFLAGLRHHEGLTRLIELMLRLERNVGPVSCAFEGVVCTPGPLSIPELETQLNKCFLISSSDVHALFVCLDTDHEGVEVDCVLDALTDVQATFLPHALHSAEHDAASESDSASATGSATTNAASACETPVHGHASEQAPAAGALPGPLATPVATAKDDIAAASATATAVPAASATIAASPRGRQSVAVASPTPLGGGKRISTVAPLRQLISPTSTFSSPTPTQHGEGTSDTTDGLWSSLSVSSQPLQGRTSVVSVSPMSLQSAPSAASRKSAIWAHSNSASVDPKGGLASTALPDDSDTDEEEREREGERDGVQRPWTSTPSSMWKRAGSFALQRFGTNRNVGSDNAEDGNHQAAFELHGAPASTRMSVSGGMLLSSRRTLKATSALPSLDLATQEAVSIAGSASSSSGATAMGFKAQVNSATADGNDDEMKDQVPEISIGRNLPGVRAWGPTGTVTTAEGTSGGSSVSGGAVGSSSAGGPNAWRPTTTLPAEDLGAVGALTVRRASAMPQEASAAGRRASAMPSADAPGGGFAPGTGAGTPRQPSALLGTSASTVRRSGTMPAGKAQAVDPNAEARQLNRQALSRSAQASQVHSKQASLASPGRTSTLGLSGARAGHQAQNRGVGSVDRQNSGGRASTLRHGGSGHGLGPDHGHQGLSHGHGGGFSGHSQGHGESHGKSAGRGQIGRTRSGLEGHGSEVASNILDFASAAGDMLPNMVDAAPKYKAQHKIRHSAATGRHGSVAQHGSAALSGAGHATDSAHSQYQRPGNAPAIPQSVPEDWRLPALSEVISALQRDGGAS
eukprot:TRINITY_DN609_c0_g3_i2.p1 TRINITY_DN609_c0_g3~~TRINITY_DN609_c0_g3_i2.p1  ORF type:complete len:3947 (-),score=892.15 TRINITY_DN609_c0_g3_i2:21-11861(-)